EPPILTHGVGHRLDSPVLERVVRRVTFVLFLGCEAGLHRPPKSGQQHRLEFSCCLAKFPVPTRAGVIGGKVVALRGVQRFGREQVGHGRHLVGHYSTSKSAFNAPADFIACRIATTSRADAPIVCSPRTSSSTVAPSLS